MGSRRWNNLTKIIVSVTLATLALILLITFRVLITPTIVAFLLAFILSYPVNWIQRSTGWARPIAVTFTYLGLLTVLILMPVLILPRLADLVLSLQSTLERLVEDLRNVSTGPLLSVGPVNFSLDMLFQQAGEFLGNLLVIATGNPLSLARGLTNSLITIVYVLVLGFWLLKDHYKLQRLVMDQIPVDYQEDVRRLGLELGQIWHAFMRGQLTLALVVALLTWVPLVIIGMPNAGALALLAGVLEFLPSIGPAISGTIGTVFALFQGSSWLPANNLTFAIIVSLLYAIIGQLESIYLIPRLVGGQVRLHPALAFVGVIAGTLVFGLLGVLLAMPIMASARTILSYIYRKLFDLDPFEPLRTPQASIRIPGLIAGRKIDAIIFDLDGTLAQLDWTAPEWVESHLQWLDDFITPDRRARDMRRLMAGMEGTINFIVSQSRRFKPAQQIEHELPWLNYLRGHPPAAALTPIADVPEMLEQLADQYQLVIVSTRPQAEILCFLQNAGISPARFALLIGREDEGNLLPHSDPLISATSRLLLEPNQVLMVSDTDSNLRSARAIEMATVGVLCGLGEEGDLLDSDLILASTAELLDWLWIPTPQLDALLRTPQ
ncbi:MAG: AI-2E family transporter [Caldilineaceae bacterium]|nr:AI-2E family transporter [Caldilineaceae bacterium]